MFNGRDVRDVRECCISYTRKPVWKAQKCRLFYDFQKKYAVNYVSKVAV